MGLAVNLGDYHITFHLKHLRFLFDPFNNKKCAKKLPYAMFQWEKIPTLSYINKKQYCLSLM